MLVIRYFPNTRAWSFCVCLSIYKQKDQKTLLAFSWSLLILFVVVVPLTPTEEE